MMHSQPFRRPIILIFIGSLLIIIAVTNVVVFPKIYEEIMNEKLVIKPGSEMLGYFKNAPMTIFFQVRFFNITNTEDVYKGAKPKLQHLGPYTYRQRYQRVGIRWNQSLGTVIFKVRRDYYFDSTLSQGTEDDQITTVNPIFITMASKVSGNDVSPAVKALAQLWFIRFGFQPFMTHSVGELLFRGYDEPLLKSLYQLTNDPLHANAMAGFFYPKNGSLEEESEVFTGELGMGHYQEHLKWNHADKLNYWNDDYCKMLNGSDGSRFPRPVSKHQPKRFFIPEMCRSVYAIYEKEVELGPLRLYRFVIPFDILTKSPESECFKTSNFTYRKSMLDLTPCLNAPIIFSTPHFYMGEKEDINSIEGLKPRKEEHESFVDVEPNTGFTFRSAKRMQLNLPLRRYAGFPALANVQELILPVLWVNESLITPIERVEIFHDLLTIPLLVMKYGSLTVLFLGFLLIVIAVIYVVFNSRKNTALTKRRQNLSDTASSGLHCKKLLEINGLVS